MKGKKIDIKEANPSKNGIYKVERNWKQGINPIFSCCIWHNGEWKNKEEEFFGPITAWYENE